jgi:glycerol-3-phosphate acyltransferase PlsX
MATNEECIGTGVVEPFLCKNNTKNLSKVIAIDGMGGDFAPESIMRGISVSCISGYHFKIYGDKNKLEAYRSIIPSDVSYEIIHTDVAITSEMEVMSALRVGKNSSMGLAIRAVSSGEASAVISSGNTGLYMALAKIILKTIDGIDRPAIASIIPGKGGRSICLDLGANAECTVKNMVDFAIMGEALAISAFDKNDVKLALLNIGSEDGKGCRLVKKTSEILKKLFNNYVGFVEGDDLGKGEVDVIVMDGFTGNVALKTIEGTAKYISHEIKKALSSGIFSKIGALLASSSLKKFKEKMDPRLYNGAILLGLNGVVVKSHGNSDEVGFANAIKFTTDVLNRNILCRIREQIDKSKLDCALEALSEEDNRR